MNKYSDIDKLDRKILFMLMQDAKIPYTDIAKKLNVSGGTIHVRMKKLEDNGIVTGSSLHINEASIGYGVKAYIGVYLDKSSLYQDVIDQLKEIPEVVHAAYTTGQYSIFAKIICKDTDDLRRILSNQLQRISGIQRTETFISLEESISRPINILTTSDEEN